jgi:hypothetical protein
MTRYRQAFRPLVVITARASPYSFGNTSIAPRERIGVVVRSFIDHASATNAAANASRDWPAEQGFDDVFLDTDPADGAQRAARSAHGRGGART